MGTKATIMKEIVKRIIELMDKDNSDFLAEFPDKKPIFDYRIASDEEIKEFEKDFNIKLTEQISEYLKQFNAIKSNIMFTELLGLNSIRKNYGNLLGYSEALSQGLFPIADNDGDLVCINTKKEKGKLLIYSHEENDFQEVRDTFETFLSELIKRKEKHIYDNIN